ncbi:hypothetical protein ACOXXX_21075 [Thalassococcus sp. BH17M4-6]|uniref:hypothetical protein n=1 Tax=Thalassococcus sp. BH17M4-6 TaxID=3413148 RepID=UPI003BE7B437
MKKIAYIAETKGEGIVECVWIASGSKGRSSVFDPRKHRFDPSKPSVFHGAEPRYIKSWLEKAQSSIQKF